MREQLTEKIQVLISKDNLKELNKMILLTALDNGERPEPLSTFVRNLLQREIKLYNEKNLKVQTSYIQKDIKEITRKK
jgi:hypothetical protein